MSDSNSYFHNRVVLLLLSVNTFLALLATSAIFVQLRGVHESFYVSYRSNLGLNAFQPGGAATFVAFVGFIFFVLIFHFILSRRMYHIRKKMAPVVLGLGTLLILLALIVSNALLGPGLKLF